MDPGGPSPSGRKKSIPGYTFGNKLKIKDPNEGSPGPGAYSTVRPKPDGPSYTMPGRYPDKDKSTPGPGSYDLATNTTNRASAPCFTFGARRDSSPDPTPGPAQYNPQPPYPNPMAFSIGKKVYRKPSLTPGPGDYKLPDSSFHANKGTSFSKPAVKGDGVERSRARSVSPELWSQKSGSSSPEAEKSHGGKPASLRGGAYLRSYSRATTKEPLDFNLREICDSLHKRRGDKK